MPSLSHRSVEIRTPSTPPAGSPTPFSAGRWNPLLRGCREHTAAKRLFRSVGKAAVRAGGGGGVRMSRKRCHAYEWVSSRNFGSGHTPCCECTAGTGEVRIGSVQWLYVLLCLQVPNMACHGMRSAAALHRCHILV